MKNATWLWFDGHFSWEVSVDADIDQPPRNLELRNYASRIVLPSKSSQKSNCSPRNLPKRRTSMTSPLSNQRRRWNARMYHVVQEEYTGGLISNHARRRRRRRGVSFTVPIPPSLASRKTLEPQLSWMAIRERTQTPVKFFEELPCEDEQRGGDGGKGESSHDVKARRHRSTLGLRIQDSNSKQRREKDRWWWWCIIWEEKRDKDFGKIWRDGADGPGRARVAASFYIFLTCRRGISRPGGLDLRSKKNKTTGTPQNLSPAWVPSCPARTPSAAQRLAVARRPDTCGAPCWSPRVIGAERFHGRCIVPLFALGHHAPKKLYMVRCHGLEARISQCECVRARVWTCAANSETYEKTLRTG